MRTASHRHNARLKSLNKEIQKSCDLQHEIYRRFRSKRKTYEGFFKGYDYKKERMDKVRARKHR
jgi:hypothetical protein